MRELLTVSRRSEATQDFFTSLRMKMSQEKLSTPFSQHAVIYAAVDAIARNIAGLPFVIQSAHSESEADFANPLLTLFEEPNPMMSKSDFFYFIMLWLMLSGECIVVKEGAVNRVSNITEIPAELWPINGAAFKHKVDKRTKLISHWVLNEGTPDEVVYYPHEVIHIRLPNPYNQYRGLAPLSAAMAAARTDWASSRFNEAYFNNGADPGGIITYPEKVKLTEGQKDEVVQSWDDDHKGPDKNMRTAILDRGASYQSLGATHRDMQWSRLREWNRDEILMVYGVPQSVAGREAAR
jgi:HK97 family phage portal protein